MCEVLLSYTLTWHGIVGELLETCQKMGQALGHVCGRNKQYTNGDNNSNAVASLNYQNAVVSVDPQAILLHPSLETP